MAEKSPITDREREEVVKYLKSNHFASGRMSDEKYDMLVATRLQDIVSPRQALKVLGIDESQVQEIPPVCFHGYLFDDDTLEEMGVNILSAVGQDGEWRSSAYMVTWIFFGNDEIYFYQEVFCLNADYGWISTDEIFYTDVEAFYTLTTKEEGKKTETAFYIMQPGRKKEVRLTMNERNMAAIEGMKQKLREKKLQK